MITAADIAARITRLNLDGHRGPLPRTVQRFLFGHALFADWPVEIDARADTIVVSWDNDAGFTAIRTEISFARIAQQVNTLAGQKRRSTLVNSFSEES